MKYRTLANKVIIPAIGYGTGMPNEQAQLLVSQAIQSGYRLIDTAEMYNDEIGVGKGMQDSEIPRDQLFISSKLDNPITDYEQTMVAFKKSLVQLNTNYLDLFLIHWPNPTDIRPHWETRNANCWRALEDLYLDGRIRAIGVSNFWENHLLELEKTQRIAPMVNQLFLTPGERQEKVVTYCESHEIQVEAYSPLGKGKIMQVEILKEIADKNNMSIAQVALSWSIDHNFIPIPRSTNTRRMAENINSLNFKLTSNQIKKIDKLDGILGKSADPDTI